MQVLRSSVKGQRPVAGAREAGELYTSFPDRQLGVIDAAKNPVDLVGVRFFSTAADYVAGDFVVQGGQLYRARVPVSAGAFAPASWDAVLTFANDGAGSGLDADLLDGNDSTYFVSQAGFNSVVAGLAPINSPTFTGDARAQTPATTDNDQSIATTAFVKAQGYISPDAPNDGTQYVRKNLVWSPVSVPPGTTISDNAPSSPQPGQLWWQSSTGNLYIWYDDGNTQQWVQINSASAGGVRLGQCYLDMYTNLTLLPYQGNLLWINGVNQPIPAGGVTLAPTGLPTGAVYIYAYMAGATMTLEFSATAYVVDASGWYVKSGDPTRTFVGMVNVLNAGAWPTTNVVTTASWFNPKPKSFRTAAVGPTTTSTTPIELSSTLRVFFAQIGGRYTQYACSSSPYQSAAGDCYANFGRSNAVGIMPNYRAARFTASGSALQMPQWLGGSDAFPEGGHYISPLGWVAAGTGTWLNAWTEVTIFG
jgi:hypothetical protein